MNREEALAKIKELENYIKDLDNKVGYEDDKIFLLSTEEYEKYKKVIPHINSWWWLRSPGYDQNYAACVYYDGSVDFGGSCVYDDYDCVRPCIKFDSLNNMNIGDRILVYGFPWIVIDNNLAIAEVPIDFKRFDNNSNEYKTSEIRKFLLGWTKSRY